MVQVVDGGNQRSRSRVSRSSSLPVSPQYQQNGQYIQDSPKSESILESNEENQMSQSPPIKNTNSENQTQGQIVTGKRSSIETIQAQNETPSRNSNNSPTKEITRLKSLKRPQLVLGTNEQLIDFSSIKAPSFESLEHLSKNFGLAFRTLTNTARLNQKEMLEKVAQVFFLFNFLYFLFILFI